MSGQSDAQLFSALAREGNQRIDDFNVQNLANTAWAFATAGKPAPALLDPILVLDTMVLHGVNSQVTCYQTLMHSLAATGQIEAGFVLLSRVEASALLSHSDNDCYPMCQILLQACRLTCESSIASHAQAAVKRLGLVSLAPTATAFMQGSMPSCEKQVGIESMANAQQQWLSCGPWCWQGRPNSSPAISEHKGPPRQHGRLQREVSRTFSCSRHRQQQ